MGGAAGYSIELIHPALDNGLGGSWRPSDLGLGRAEELIPAGAVWRYLKGTAEASNPRPAWRALAFSDASWGTGRTSMGYGEAFVSTTLDDMRDGYVSVYLRKTFTVADLASAVSLLLEVQYDDGFNAWINGVHVAGANVPSNDMPFDGAALSALENAGYEEFQLPAPSSYLVQGTNVLAVHFFNVSIGGSSDAFFDARLTSSDTTGRGPTPGARNAVYSATAPPQLRDVDHLPAQPATGLPVVVSVKATDPDGMASVTLEYQIVEPGSYIRLTDPEYAAGWTAVVMNDGGSAGDVAAGDGVFSGTVPASVQVHRRLVRYRITAENGAGASVRVPHAEDPQPNFAYFVYDAIPAWRGSVQPGVKPVRTFSPVVMSSIPAYHLIAREADVINCQYNSSFEAVHFLGTMVYEGIVHDHMEFENRGEFSTYVSGKNKWRFHFNRSHDFQARDNHGRKFRTAWRTMNVSACASPWVPTNRGLAGLDESVAFRLYELAGLPSPKTNYFQLRVVDEAIEAHATDQYRGDVWGLYLTTEHTDGRFLDERGLPDGNTYKIEGGAGDKRNQGPTQSKDTSDYDTYRNGFNGSQSLAWWRANCDLEGYYAFRAIDRVVNNMDLRDGWNHCQYHNSATGRWTAIPWDLDMLYMPVTHWSGVINLQNALSQHAELAMEYRNRARALLDLLVTPQELGLVVDEYAARINPPGAPLTFVDVDEAMWNYHPRTAGGHRGNFYRNPSTHSAIGGSLTRTLVSADLEGMAQWVKDFTLADYGFDGLTAHAADAAIPNRPTATYIGPPGHPIDALVFRASAFSDPNGAGTFGGMKWRLAEVTPPGSPPFDPLRPKVHEIDAAWESPELSTFAAEIAIPPDALKFGARYRVRVRMKDTTRRWSQWSAGVELTAGQPTAPFPQQAALRITEVMYHPAEDGDLEFIELKNVGPAALDLRPVAFVEGIEFRFAAGAVVALQPGEIAVVVKDLAVFSAWYDLTGMKIAGDYSGSLANEGEKVTLVHGGNAAILDFTYGEWYPPTDGGGYSLVIVDPAGPPVSWNEPESWTTSGEAGGSPGRDDGPPPTGGWQLVGDSNQDAAVDISDALSLLLRLFGGSAAPLPCDGETLESPGNLTVFDLNGDVEVDASDAVHLLRYLFTEGPAPANGSNCARVEGCPSACGV